MKRNIKWIAAVLCLSVFAAMASGKGQSDSEETKQVVSNEGTENADADANASNDSVDSPDAVVTIDEQVLVVQDGIIVTATEYVTDSIRGDGIKLLLENNSDKDVTVGCNALIVNDYMITDLFSSGIAAGKKSNETLYFSSTQLKAAGIENVGKIEIYFHIFDSSTYDTVTVDENSFWETAILLYLENNSGQNVDISVDDIAVLSSDLEENGIEAVEQVELKFHIYDADSYSVIADSEPITFSAQQEEDQKIIIHKLAHMRSAVTIESSGGHFFFCLNHIHLKIERLSNKHKICCNS